MKPLRPGHLKQRLRTSGDIELNWTRRARHSADRWETSDVPLLEEELSFEIEVSMGGIIVHTETVSDTDWTYTLADQAADGVAGSELTFEVSQLSLAFGKGVPAQIGG